VIIDVFIILDSVIMRFWHIGRRCKCSYKPFNVANEIPMANFNGKVISIKLRYTKLDGGGNKRLIPNAKLFTDSIIVFD